MYSGVGSNSSGLKMDILVEPNTFGVFLIFLGGGTFSLLTH